VTLVVLAASPAMFDSVQEADDPVVFIQHRTDEFRPLVRDFKDELFTLDLADEGRARSFAAELVAPCAAAVVVCGDTRFAGLAGEIADLLHVPLLTEPKPEHWLQQALELRGQEAGRA
jgi:hypothetical protein